MPSKICKNPDCKTKYEWEKGDPAYPPFRVWCSIDCGMVISRIRTEKAKEKKKKKQEREFKQETQRRRKKIRTKSEWTKRVNTAFNTYIKIRDWDKPCGSCNKFEAEPINGVMWDCGHFVPTGSHPELRWCEANAHRQHSRCNRGAAKHARNDRSVSAQYDTNLRARIGGEIVDWLQGPHEQLHILNDELEALELYYKKLTKEAKELRDDGQPVPHTLTMDQINPTALNALQPAQGTLIPNSLAGLPGQLSHIWIDDE